MLSDSWAEHQIDSVRRRNLYRHLAKIMLSLSRERLPKIGSWTLDANGYLALANRPLTFRLHALENEGIPTEIDRTQTYSATDSYYLDLLACHDNRIRFQPNSVRDKDDGEGQMATIVAMRALLPQFISRKHREGPFFLQLTDCHASNLFVDEAWNIKYIIDLEWACSLPPTFLRPPYWLANTSLDDLTGENLDRYQLARREFMDIFQEEEICSQPPPTSAFLSSVMNQCWACGEVWYTYAMESPKGLYNIFRDHLKSRYIAGGSCSEMALYWAPNAEHVLGDRLRQKEQYATELQVQFNEGIVKNCD